jgi:hypothetical protein
MMLSKYAKYPPDPPLVVGPKKHQKKVEPKEDGERSKATEWFNGLEINPQLLKTTVLLSTLQGYGSGVILGVNGTKAYILTAKHNLFILAGQSTPIHKDTQLPKKPSEYVLSDYSGGIKIGYGPTALLQSPENPPNAATAPVTAINFADVAESGDSWTYDAILLECTNTDFYNFVNTNRFINKANYAGYKSALRLIRGKYQLLDRTKFDYIQLGYGDARAKDMDIDVDNYTSYEKKIQCKQSVPVAATPSPGLVFEPRSKDRDRSKWRRMSEAVELIASNTSSTAPGDSGGPLFAIGKTNKTKFALVGVTSGANFFSEETKLRNPPSDRVIHNNDVTYWHEVFKYCRFLDRE